MRLSSRRTACRRGGPAPQDADLNTAIPNNETLLMNPGDTIRIPHVRRRRRQEVVSLRSGHRRPHPAHQRVYASVRGRGNGFETTNGIVDGAVTPAARGRPSISRRLITTNRSATGQDQPVGANVAEISTEFETGHFEPCTSLGDEITNPFDPSDTGGTYNECFGPYETDNERYSRAWGGRLLLRRRHPPQRLRPRHLIATGGGHRLPGQRFPERRPGLRRHALLAGVAHRQRPDHLPVDVRRIFPHLERPAVLAVLLPDGHRAERVDCLGNTLGSGGGTSSGCTVPPPGPATFTRTGVNYTSAISVHSSSAMSPTAPASPISARTPSTARTCSARWVTPSSKAVRTTTTAGRRSASSAGISQFGRGPQR